MAANEADHDNKSCQVSTVVAAAQPNAEHAAAADKEFTLEMVLSEIGEFGIYQMLILLVATVPVLFHGNYLTYAFTAGTVVHRCNISECDSAHSKYEEPWTKFAIPMQGQDIDHCNRYRNTEVPMQSNFSSLPSTADNAICIASKYDRNAIIACPNNDFILRDNEVTISNEFGIYCDDEWKLSLVGTFNNIGNFFGIPLGGFVSDKYGRRTALAFAGFFGGIVGFSRSFATNYEFFLILELIEQIVAGTLYATTFIIGIEMVGPKQRVLACCLLTLIYPIGPSLVALIAKFFPDFRVMMRICYGPMLLNILLLWLLPESVRWLLSQGKEEQAAATLRNAARINRRKLTDSTLNKLFASNRQKRAAMQSQDAFPLKQAIVKLFWRLASCSACWIMVILVYFGLSLNAVSLAGDKYMNFIYVQLIEIPGYILPLFMIDRWGRRYCLLGFMLICGICCLATIFTTAPGWMLFLFLAGKLAITIAFQVLYFYTSEIFPTNVRNSLLSLCSMVGRIGSMIAPHTALLAKLYVNGPAILYTIVAFLSAILCLFYPETTNLILPTTVQEATEIGRNQMELKPTKSKSTSQKTQSDN